MRTDTERMPQEVRNKDIKMPKGQRCAEAIEGGREGAGRNGGREQARP